MSILSLIGISIRLIIGRQVGFESPRVHIPYRVYLVGYILILYPIGHIIGLWLIGNTDELY